MKKFILIISILLVSCASHYDADDFDTKAIYEEARATLRNQQESGDVHKDAWPKLYQDIGVKSVIVRKDGLYIVLNEIFVQESGLFVPKMGVNVMQGDGYDPSFKKLKNNVYSYIIRG